MNIGVVFYFSLYNLQLYIYISNLTDERNLMLDTMVVFLFSYQFYLPLGICILREREKKQQHFYPTYLGRQALYEETDQKP